jgi:glycosyltransferase involved in cell wall biosynthesis
MSSSLSRLSAPLDPPSSVGPGRRLRVLQITDNLGTGGLEQVAVTLCRNMDRSLFEPAALCIRFVGELASRLAEVDVPVYQLPQVPGKANYLAFRSIARMLRQLEIDVVHTHNSGPLLDGGLGALAAGVKTLIHTDHARDFPDKLRYMLMEHALSHFAYRVVGVSEHTVSNLRRYERISPRKLAMIPNGIELGAYSMPIDRAEKRRALGLPETGPIVGVTSRLAEPKGVTYLLKALPQLFARFDDLSVVIAGTGKLLDGLKAEARELGVAERVWFLGLRMDVPELLQLFDVYVLPSISEGLPMAVLEAMAAGRAIVATDVGGVGTVIRSAETGLLVAPRAPAALSDAITRLLVDDALRFRLGEAARRAVRARFSAAAMTRQYEQLYLRQPGAAQVYS